MPHHLQAACCRVNFSHEEHGAKVGRVILTCDFLRFAFDVE